MFFLLRSVLWQIRWIIPSCYKKSFQKKYHKTPFMISRDLFTGDTIETAKNYTQMEMIIAPAPNP